MRRTDSPTRPSSSRREGALTIGSVSLGCVCHRRAGRRYARSGWWSGVAPIHSAWSRARRHPDRVEDLRVPRAPAEIAAQGLPDLVVRRVRHVRQQIHGRHDQPRCAEPALHGARRRERLLHRMERPVRPEPLHRHDLVPVRLHRQHQTRADQRPVEQDRARPALALLARVLRAGQPHVLAQRVEKALALPDLGLHRLPVDGEGDPHVRHLFSARPTSTFSAWTRYAAVPRTSSIGDASRATRSASSHTFPSPTRTSPGFGPADPYATRISSASGSTAKHRETTAITIAFRGPTFMKVCRISRGSRRTATISSSARSAFCFGPVRKRTTGTTRTPRAADATTTSAS